MKLENCWEVISILAHLDPCGRKRKTVTAKCARCRFMVRERYEHFVRRTACPSCEMESTRARSIITGRVLREA